MKVVRQLVALLLAAAPWPAAHPAVAQTSTPATPLAAAAQSAVPALVPYAGVATAGDGKALANDATITFQIYKEEQGGDPLWTETQTVAIDAAGHYKVQLGATDPNGLPADLFVSGEARWLQVQIAGENPQTRVLLASVPYALKAGDAATLGGLPASAYALAGTQTSPVTAAAPSSSASDWVGRIVTSPGGTVNKLAKFSDPAKIVDSLLFDNGTNVGIGTVTPAATLDVNGNAILRGDMTLSPTGNATAAAGADSRNLIFTAEAWDSATKTAAATNFQWKGEPSGNNTASPAATLNLLISNGGAAEETGFYFLPNGTLHFAPGQSFPITGTGGGTITGVTAGTGLTGGGTSGNVTLSLNTSQVPLLTANNGFTGNEFVSGSVNALSTGYFAIQGVDSNASGSAVTGMATSAGGYSSGVYGSSASPNGTGVAGVATNVTGNAIGTSGTSVSPQGVGVQGVNNATTGGSGIVGVATAAKGYSTGVYGKSLSVNGAGVSGQATSSTGFAVGVNGASVSPQGAGVQGVNNSTKGGTGILGYAAATSGYTNGVYAYAVSPNGTGVNGAATSTTGYTNGVYGSSASPTGTGVHGDVTAPNGQGIYGTNEATAGPANGVLGVTASSAGSGVSGTATATSGYPVGVYGTASSALGVGVRGDSLTTTGTGPGVYGFSTSTNGTGVSGNATSTTGNTIGVYGVSASTSGSGVTGAATSATGSAHGVSGYTSSTEGTGVFGSNDSGTGGAGVQGVAITTGAYSQGVQGVAGPGGVGVNGVSPNIGVTGFSVTSCGPPYVCPLSNGIGGQFAAGSGGLILQGVTGPNNQNVNQVFYVDASGNGYFAGNLNVTGNVSKGGGSFKIDDPLDPANKYLSHSFVESPDMMNVYNGNVTTDRLGRATVELPQYFEALNRDFRYQLTVMGQFAQAIVATKIGHNRFVIRTSKPSVEVSWQVTGIRKDAYANANRIPVEEQKPGDERGHYLHPELFDQPESKGIVAAHRSKSPLKSAVLLPGAGTR